LDAGFTIISMKNNTVRICFLFLLVMWLAGSYAQQAVLTASNDAVGSTGTVSYSVGQIAYCVNMSTGGFITEGVQQPFEILQGQGIQEINGTILEFSVYPNPASNFIILKSERTEINNLSYQLYNMNGFLLQNRKIESSEISISLEDLSPASYSLTVSCNDRAFQSFIIIRK
jgi:hypothetical protein